jgi:hypothetical protein
LRQIRHPFARAPIHGELRDIFSGEFDAPLVGPQKAYDHAESRRFSRAVISE